MRGGKREGSGRPPAESKRVPLSIYVLPEVKQIITDQNIKAGRIVEEVILDKKQ